MLNQCAVPSVGFHEGMDALRAYSIFDRPETVELVLKCNMKFKKVFFKNEVNILTYCVELTGQEPSDIERQYWFPSFFWKTTKSISIC